MAARDAVPTVEDDSRWLRWIVTKVLHENPINSEEWGAFLQAFERIEQCYNDETLTRVGIHRLMRLIVSLDSRMQVDSLHCDHNIWTRARAMKERLERATSRSNGLVIDHADTVESVVPASSAPDQNATRIHISNIDPILASTELCVRPRTNPKWLEQSLQQLRLVYYQRAQMGEADITAAMVESNVMVEAYIQLETYFHNPVPRAIDVNWSTSVNAFMSGGFQYEIKPAPLVDRSKIGSDTLAHSFYCEFVQFWNALMPSCRKAETKYTEQPIFGEQVAPKDFGDWEKVCRCGQCGFNLVIMALSWWFCILEPHNKTDINHYRDAVADVTWVLRQLVTGGEAGLITWHEEEEDSSSRRRSRRVSKRKACEMPVMSIKRRIRVNLQRG